MGLVRREGGVSVPFAREGFGFVDASVLRLEVMLAVRARRTIEEARGWELGW